MRNNIITITAILFVVFNFIRFISADMYNVCVGSNCVNTDSLENVNFIYSTPGGNNGGNSYINSLVSVSVGGDFRGNASTIFDLSEGSFSWHMGMDDNDNNGDDCPSTSQVGIIIFEDGQQIVESHCCNQNGGCRDGSWTQSVTVSETFSWYKDSDNDGYGNEAEAITSLTKPNGYSSNGNDCNDANFFINPAASEVCDAVDNNCNGEVDENLINTPVNQFGLCFSNSQVCILGLWYNSLTNYFPVAEICENGFDDDCDGETDLEDDDCSQCSTDSDCGDSTLIENFCEGTNLMNKWGNPICSGYFCEVIYSQDLNTSCQFGCLNGACQNQCSTDLDCGVESVANTFCFRFDLYENKSTPTCSSNSCAVSYSNVLSETNSTICGWTNETDPGNETNITVNNGTSYSNMTAPTHTPTDIEENDNVNFNFNYTNKYINETGNYSRDGNLTISVFKDVSNLLDAFSHIAPSNKTTYDWSYNFNDAGTYRVNFKMCPVSLLANETISCTERNVTIVVDEKDSSTKKKCCSTTKKIGYYTDEENEEFKIISAIRLDEEFEPKIISLTFGKNVNFFTEILAGNFSNIWTNYFLEILCVYAILVMAIILFAIIKIYKTL